MTVSRPRRVVSALALGAVALTLEACSRPAPRDVVVVTLDTVRADRLGAYGNRDRLTPNLDRLAAGGVVFEDVTAPAPVTLPSHASLFTARYPTRTGVRNNGTFVVPAEERTLAEVLKGAGWSTAAVVASYPLHARYGLAQGFDVYDDDFPELVEPEGGGIPVFFPERHAREVTDRAIEIWNRMGPGPRLLWVHYFDAHAPYAPPAPWSDRHPGAPYDGEVAYVDSEVGRLLDALGETGRPRIVAVVADHGESLGDHGEKTHGVFVYQSTLRVPWILCAPGELPAATRVAAPASLVDVVPTLLDLLGLPPLDDAQGASLLATVRGGDAPDRPVYGESFVPKLDYGFSELRTLRAGTLKYIDAPAPELYDLASDPGERDDLGGDSAEARRIAGRLQEFVKDEDADAESRAAGRLDAKAIANLRSLGYVAGGPGGGSPSGRGRDPKTMVTYLRDYDRALGMLSEARFDEGVALLRRLVPQAPENDRVPLQIGAALLAAGKLDDAEHELSALVERSPRLLDALLLLGDVDGRLGRIDAAITRYREAAAVAPDSPEPPLRLGRLLESVGRFDEAAGAYRDSVAKAPSDPETSAALVALRTSRGDLALAATELDRLIGATPEAVALRCARGRVALRAGDAAAAEHAFRAALDREPAGVPQRLGLGEALLAEGRPDAAEPVLRALVQDRPSSADARLALGRALSRLGRTAEADAQFAAARELRRLRK